MHGRLGVGGDVEPDPAAIFKRLKSNFELRCGARGFVVAGNLTTADADARTGGLRPIDIHAGGAGQLDPQHDRIQRGPTPPVTGGERVEVGGEGHLRLRSDLQLGATDGVGAARVGVGILDVELAHIERFARAREDHPGQQTDRSGVTRRDRPGGDFAHGLLLSSVPSACSGAPSRR